MPLKRPAGLPQVVATIAICAAIAGGVSAGATPPLPAAAAVPSPAATALGAPASQQPTLAPEPEPESSTTLDPQPSSQTAASSADPRTGRGRIDAIAHAAALTPPAPAWHVPVLTYHLVATTEEAGNALPSLVVSPALFDAQLRALRAAGWRTITAATLAADLAAGTPPARRSIVITLDDGHLDGYTHAFPILRANGFVATFYVITGRQGLTGYITPAQLTEMAAGGMEIGNHTVDHVPLATLSDARATAEIADASAWIATLLGSPPTTIAYPFGSFSPSVVEDARSLGLSMAFTTQGGCRETLGNRLTVPRLHVGPSTTPGDLVALVAGCG